MSENFHKHELLCKPLSWQLFNLGRVILKRLLQWFLHLQNDDINVFLPVACNALALCTPDLFKYQFTLTFLAKALPDYL